MIGPDCAGISDAEYAHLVEDMADAAAAWDAEHCRCDRYRAALRVLYRAALNVQEVHLLTTPAMRAALTEAWELLGGRP